MMINDPLSDMIARIKNAATRKRSKVLTPASRLRQRVLDVLQDEGYIRGYNLVQNPCEFPQFEIELKYFDGQPVIAEIARVSKPGRRVYSAIGDLKPVKNGLGISILSTSKGVMSDAAARDANVGGEVARAVGHKMAALGTRHQVVAITHFPQVAAIATHHFVVQKEVSAGRTRSRLFPVVGETRIQELVRMLGGGGDQARAMAASLLKI
jgi:small subunit ribosomal protein S8